jgi:hypothetical protein
MTPHLFLALMNKGENSYMDFCEVTFALSSYKCKHLGHGKANGLDIDP